MSDLKHACHECGRNIAYPEQMFGQTVSCPHCAKETSLGEVYPNAPSAVSYLPPGEISSPAPDLVEYFVTRKRKKLGPYSLEGVQGYLETGFLKSSDLGWCEGMQDWKPLNTIEGITVAKQILRPLPPANTQSVENASKMATFAEILVGPLFVILGGCNFLLFIGNVFGATKYDERFIFMPLHAILAIVFFVGFLTQPSWTRSIMIALVFVALFVFMVS